jgi:hypothetical protein
MGYLTLGWSVLWGKKVSDGRTWYFQYSCSPWKWNIITSNIIYSASHLIEVDFLHVPENGVLSLSRVTLYEKCLTGFVQYLTVDYLTTLSVTQPQGVTEVFTNLKRCKGDKRPIWDKEHVDANVCFVPKWASLAWPEKVGVMWALGSEIKIFFF